MAITLLAGACAAKPEFNPPKGTALPPPESADSALSYARIGETVAVGGPRVTPLTVLEDSRCPMNARCVWAGQVRLSVRVETGAGTRDMEITTGKPLPVADGTLELAEVQPDRVAGGDSGGQIKPQNYRFGFSFVDGL
ncbi:hypothetical protein GCM10011614_24610 [Novosphingobium colocasiae]|uniref:Uncharacterized protein n=1 Tax=Novosphingobium colocasiae TaxID=1256513 RepID=A0A918UGK9_9SPHN|nr:hypothetical protein GCM10011614_24610 [Novosphingobium colocasiae]